MTMCVRIRLANLLAPVAGEANMGGPLGWIADSILYGMLDVSQNEGCTSYPLSSFSSSWS